MDIVFNLLTAAVLAGTPLLLGTLGEILTEKSGNLNLGVEGMMFMGAIAGIAGSWFTEQWFSGGGFAAAFVGLITSFLAGCLGALIYAFLTITLRANQNVTVLTLTIFGTGFGNPGDRSAAVPVQLAGVPVHYSGDRYGVVPE